jgi:LDH2 family malate/lactate/ureidoglycolate dehydrogenase
MSEVRVPVDVARSFARDAASTVGMDDQGAGLFAESVLTASLRGIDTHGVGKTPWILHGIATGAINGSPKISPSPGRGGAVSLDADNGLGNVVGYLAMEHAIEVAKKQGIAMVAVHNSNYTGLLSFASLLAAENGMIGFFTNDGPSVMAAWGGIVPALHNNPFSYALPTQGVTGFPILYDAACSAVARTKIRAAAAAGEAIPEGWALGPDGLATTDARKALEGVVLPMSEHKGYALAAVLEMLTAGLSGANLSFEVSKSVLGEDSPGLDTWGSGHLAMAIDPEAFLPRAVFEDTIRRMVDNLRSSPLAPGVDRIVIPGELEWERTQERTNSGIPLTTKEFEKLNEFAAEIGIDSLAERAPSTVGEAA